MATNVVQFATPAELEQYLGQQYPLPAEPDRVLQRASEVIEQASFGAAGRSWFVVDVDHPEDQYIRAIRDAVCAQVEFWMETGEEFDVGGLQGAIGISRLQISKLPDRLGVRAYRHLRNVGLMSNYVAYSQ